jgi:hypothetical protein
MLLVLLAVPANATVLTFDADPAFVDYQIIPQDYGDRVSSSPQPADPPNYSYGAAGGWTPNVVVQYASEFGDISFFSTDYGDLTNVIENEYDGNNKLYITFTADPGYLVHLQAFDLGGWPHTNQTVYSITVSDGSTTLYSASDVLAPGSGHNTVSPDVQAQELILTLDIRLGFDSDYVGLDNIQFSQSLVPIPGSLLLLGTGLLGLGVFRAKKRRD